MMPGGSYVGIRAAGAIAIEVAIVAGFFAAASIPPAQIVGRIEEDRASSGANSNAAASKPQAIHEFSFEERATHPWDLPPAFERLTGVDELLSAGRVIEYTTFGSISFDEQHVHSGAWSLRFDLDGGSMAVGLATEEHVPAIAGEQFQLTAFVRTEGLRYAVPRMTAMYVDQSGGVIESSLRFAGTADTTGEWIELRIELPPAPEDAVAMTLRLEVLQPADRRARISEFEPLFEDVAGSVWFDDVTIQRLPSALG